MSDDTSSDTDVSGNSISDNDDYDLHISDEEERVYQQGTSEENDALSVVVEDIIHKLIKNISKHNVFYSDVAYTYVFEDLDKLRNKKPRSNRKVFLLRKEIRNLLCYEAKVMLDYYNTKGSIIIWVIVEDISKSALIFYNSNDKSSYEWSPFEDLTLSSSVSEKIEKGLKK